MSPKRRHSYDHQPTLRMLTPTWWQPILPGFKRFFTPNSVVIRPGSSLCWVRSRPGTPREATPHES